MQDQCKTNARPIQDQCKTNARPLQDQCKTTARPLKDIIPIDINQRHKMTRFYINVPDPQQQQQQSYS